MPTKFRTLNTLVDQPFSLSAQKLIREFCQSTREYFLLAHSAVPLHHNVQFAFPPLDYAPCAFLWTQLQLNELNIPALRIHALYIRPNTPAIFSQRITRHFEQHLTRLAHINNAKEIGFYTRRNPHAFLRRLNRTAPDKHNWQLDSYVCVRRVPPHVPPTTPTATK